MFKRMEVPLISRKSRSLPIMFHKNIQVVSANGQVPAARKEKGRIIIVRLMEPAYL